jgi:MinD-like ATPase involved in chromosome partitioning or flagellar assembly
MLYDNLILKNNAVVDYKTVLHTEKKLLAEIEKTQRDVLLYNATMLKANTLKQDIIRLQDSLNKINERINQILVESVNPGRIYVQAWALPPEEPSDNPRKKFIPLSLIFSLFIGIAIAVARDYIKNTVTRPSDVEKVLGFPLTGYIIQSNLDSIPSADIYTVFKDKPDSFVFNQYASISMKLEGEHNKHGSQVFTFTSVKDKGGTTSLALNTLAALNVPRESKLYIELNLTNPFVGKIPGIPSVADSNDWLKTDADIDGFIQDHELFPFRVLLSNAGSDHLKMLTNLSKIKSHVQHLRNKYQYIFIDIPPVLRSTEAQGIMAFSDVGVIVAESGRVIWPELIRCIKTLDSLELKVIAVVLNRVMFMKGGYYKAEMASFYNKLEK